MITTEDSLRFKLEYEQEKSKNLFEELMEYKNRVEQLEADLADVKKEISDEQIENIIFQCDGFLKWGVGDHGKRTIRKKIRAIIKEQQTEAVTWTYGANEFKDWCSHWFGVDADESYLSKAIHDLPPMAQNFKRIRSGNFAFDDGDELNVANLFKPLPPAPEGE